MNDDSDSRAPLPDALSIAAALRVASASLAAAGSANAALDAEVLLASLLGIRRGQLLARSDEPLPAELQQRYGALVARRRAGQPVAYLTGEREFWSLPLRVTSAVLVPRPETELLVECALELGLPTLARVADLGTGSGAIALALASERPHWQVVATDLSEDALQVARDNAGRLALERVRFACGDWFAALPTGTRFDLLASNPPYVATDDPALAAPELAAEPQLALRAGPDGLQCLRQLAGGAAQYLAPGGWLLLEHGASQAAAVAALLESHGYAHVRCRTDLAGRERVTMAQR